MIADALRYVSGGRVLDVGAGTGRNMEFARSRGFDVYGFDLSPMMLALAAERLGLSNMEPLLRVGDVRDIPFGDRLFDFALCCRVLSHVPDVPSALTELRRVLRRGGYALLTDVDGRHNYEATRIPTSDGDVWIRAHKHTLEEVEQAAIGSGFRIVASNLVTARNLICTPARAEFPSIDWSGQTPISYQLLLQNSD